MESVHPGRGFVHLSKPLAALSRIEPDDSRGDEEYGLVEENVEGKD